MSTWTVMNIKGQGHSLTLVQGHSDSTFSNFFSLEFARPIEVKFNMAPPWDGELKWVQMVYITWPRWPPWLYVIKTIKNLLLWNQKADDLETWHAAMVARCVLPERNTCIHLFVLPRMPCVGEDWLTLSNAFEKSIIRTLVCFPSSMLAETSSTNTSSCASQEQFFLNPCCRG